MYARSSFLFVSFIRVFASDRLPTLVDYLSQAAKRNDRVRDRLRTEHTIVFDCLQVNLIDLNMPCQPEQSHTPDWILVTYSTSSALADLFRDAKNNAYGIVCHDYLGARDRPCYVGVSCACCYMFCRGVAGLSFQARLGRLLYARHRSFHSGELLNLSRLLSPVLSRRSGCGVRCQYKAI